MTAGSDLGSIWPSLTARGLDRAVDFVEITFCQLSAGMTAGSDLGSKPGSLTARGLNRAVDLVEITFYQLNAGMTAGSHLGSIRSSLTARGLDRAVDFVEITFELLLAKSGMSKSYHHQLSKSKNLTAFGLKFSSGRTAAYAKNELA